MAKKVRVTLELDETFVRLLQACVQMKGLLKEEAGGSMDPVSVLSVLVLWEARGAHEHQIHGRTPHQWRPHIEVLHDQRVVREG